MFENRRWLVIPTSLTSSIDFNQVLESSVDTLRLSIDGSETFVKYEGDEPQCIAELTTKEAYCYHDMLNLMQTEEWQNSDNLLINND